ncbi:MAG: hypothetical protein ACYTF1_03160 [Planctomycetota bacterium]|jgi:hypothetical protein
MIEKTEQKRPPGTCLPWQEKMKELPEITGDKELVEKLWKDVDALGYVYIWHCLLSF